MLARGERRRMARHVAEARCRPERRVASGRVRERLVMGCRAGTGSVAVGCRVDPGVAGSRARAERCVAGARDGSRRRWPAQSRRFGRRPRLGSPVAVGWGSVAPSRWDGRARADSGVGQSSRAGMTSRDVPMGSRRGRERCAAGARGAGVSRVVGSAAGVAMVRSVAPGRRGLGLALRGRAGVAGAVPAIVTARRSGSGAARFCLRATGLVARACHGDAKGRRVARGRLAGASAGHVAPARGSLDLSDSACRAGWWVQ